MKKFKSIIKLMRPKHYLKNGLVLVPLLFDLNIQNKDLLTKVIIGFIAFSFTCSMVYIINDINDVESDRKSDKKKNRPIASGKVKILEAWFLVLLLCLVVSLICWKLHWNGVVWLLTYFILNIAYSFKLKHIPIIDVTILASGFLIRLLYGAAITGINVSFWLCMTVIAMSFYMGLGKRRNELQKAGENAQEIRGVLKYYNTEFLDKNMYMCLGLGITFYSFWSGAEATINKVGTNLQMWTVPLVIILSMKYSLDIEKGESGDPIEVILNDKWLIIIALIYVAIMVYILYFS